jgi:hypothetical protein
MANHQPIKQHAQRAQMLLHCRLGMRALQFLGIGRDVNRLYPSENK